MRKTACLIVAAAALLGCPPEPGPGPQPSPSPSPTASPSPTPDPSPTATPTPAPSPTPGQPGDPVGNHQHLGETSSNATGFLLGTSLQVAADVVVDKLGSVQDGAGHDVRMGLYTDAGGKPGSLLIDSGRSSIAAAGAHEIDVPDTPVAAGTYWLLATYASDSSLHAFPAYDPTSAKTVFYVEHPASDALPASPSGATYIGQDFSYYIVTVR